MATSDRFVRYLGSTKNLIGSVCGLAGLGLYLAGAVGSYWPFVVAGLYAAGALAAPPEKVTLTVADDAAAEAERLRADLDRLTERVAAHAGRMPPAAMVRFREIREILTDLLARRDLLAADPDARYELARAVRTDLPEGFETYLNLPGWFAGGRRGAVRRTAADELCAQLDLIADHLTGLAGRLLEDEARRMRDQTRYLRDRSQSEG